MVGLGNGRRGGRSPPLLVAAMVACVIVLGFNYWISSSRNAELQSHISELETRVRRAAADRTAVEMKKNEFQGQLERQKEQIDKIQSLHSLQLENQQKMCNDQMESLKMNITLSTRIILKLQGEFRDLQENYGKQLQQLQMCQRNQSSLQGKLSYDVTQCSNQIKELKEHYEERIAELTKTGNEGQSPEGGKKNAENLEGKIESRQQPPKPLETNQKENSEVHNEDNSIINPVEKKPTVSPKQLDNNEIEKNEEEPNAEKAKQVELRQGDPARAASQEKLPDAPQVELQDQPGRIQEDTREADERARENEETAKKQALENMEGPADENAIEDADNAQGEEEEEDEKEEPFQNDLELLQAEQEAVDMAAREELDARNVNQQELKQGHEKADNPEKLPNDPLVQSKGKIENPAKEDTGIQEHDTEKEAVEDNEGLANENANEEKGIAQQKDEDIEREDLMQEEEFNREQDAKDTAARDNENEENDAVKNIGQADYNGDEGNVAEFEADKQAELNGDNVKLKEADNQEELKKEVLEKIMIAEEKRKQML